MNPLPSAADPQTGLPPAARAVLLAGLTGFFFANFTAQLLSSHWGGDSAFATSAESSWGSAAYTLASFAGIVAVRPLEQRLGLRRTFVIGALVLAAFGWLQATTPSEPTLLAMRAFEGFATGGFGPKAMTAAFLLYRAGGFALARGLCAFFLLVAAVIGFVMVGASESEIGWRGLFYIQFVFSAMVALAGLRWLPRIANEAAIPSTDNVRSVFAGIPPARADRSRRRHRRSWHGSTQLITAASCSSV